MVSSAFSLLCFWFMVSSNHVTNSQLLETLQWSWSKVKMPYKASDIVGTFVNGPNGEEDGFIILTGGCDHVSGNQRASDSNGNEFFYCGSVTKRALKFDPFTSSFTELDPAPHARYRHAAVAIGEKVYLLGGRDVDDSMVDIIDVYDTKVQKWSTVGTLPSATSDLTAWAHDDHIYVTGGYDSNYTAYNATYKIASSDLTVTSGTENTTTALVTSLKPMSAARGDMHSVVYEGYAYVTGGFSSDNWCKPLGTVERYHIKTDIWQNLESLKFDRGDMAVTELFGKIMVIGGESKPYGCKNDPAEESIPQNHVEVYDPIKMVWLLYSPFKDYRFRFGAVAVKPQGRIYTFGGQLHYDKSCDCFPASNEVAIAQENLSQAKTSSSSDFSDGEIAGIVIGSLAAALILGAFIRCFTRSDKMADTAMLGDTEGLPEDKA